jgi:hypothetical protein
MPQPTLSQVHVNVPLTNMSVAYRQDATSYVATRVFPIVPSDKQSNVYYKYTKDDWFRDEATKRAPGVESSGSGYNLTNTSSFTCDVFALHKDIPDQVRNNSDAMLNPDRDATLWLTSRMLLRLEKQWAADYFTTSKWLTDTTVAAKWDDFANSDPIGDVRTGIITIQKRTGMKPNKLVLGAEVFIKLIDHPDIVARLSGGATASQMALVNENILARIFGVDEVLVCGAIENTAAEGATGTYSFVQGKSALLVYTAPNPGLMTPSGGYTFMWTGVSEGLGQTIGVRKFRMEPLKSDRIEAEIAFQNVVIGSDLGVFFPSCVN